MMWKRRSMALLLAGLFFFGYDGYSADKDIVILYTNDIHCGVQDNEGLAALVYYKEKMKEETPYVALVDAGDAIQGTALGFLTKGEAMIRLMNAAGYDVAIPGNHEFDYGMNQFLALAGQLNGGYYSANIRNRQTGDYLLPPYKLMEFGGTKIAFVGITTPDTLQSSTPVFFQDGRGQYIYSFGQEDGGRRLYADVQRAVDQAKADGAEYVIAVAHMGIGGVPEIWSSAALVRHPRDIDAVIDGHSHEINETTIVQNKENEPVPITQTGTKLKRIGKMTVGTTGRIKMKLLSGIQGRDKKMQQHIDEETSRLETVLAQPVGWADTPLYSYDPETGKRLVRNSETNLGDLVADAHRAVLHTDIALYNGGGVRGSLPQGQIMYRNMMEVLPFGNDAAAIEATGQDILNALEWGAAAYPDEAGGFLQVSGLTYTIDADTPSSVVCDEWGQFVRVAGPYRVRNVTIGGKPLERSRVYTVGGTAYILQNGGNGFTMFSQAKQVPREALTETEVLLRYIKDELQGRIGFGYTAVQGQGRIRIEKMGKIS